MQILPAPSTSRALDPRLLVSLVSSLLTLIVYLPSPVVSLCPNQCSCNDSLLKTSCSSGGLSTVPITLNPRLKELYLNDNKIREIASNSLNFYNQLEILSLSSNKLSGIGQKSFISLDRLQLLFLDTNYIVELSGNNSFRGLSSLVVLSLARNSLGLLGAATFVGLANLEELDLSSNRIESLEEGTFAGLPKLKVLSLRDNKLRQIPSYITLEELASNLLKLDLGVNAFTGQELRLADLEGMYQLADLRLDYTGLVGLDVSAGEQSADLPALKSLDLRANQLQTLPDRHRRVLRRLKCLDLRENPINCNCSMSWLKGFVENITVAETSASQSDEDTNGQAALRDDEDSFECTATYERLLLTTICYEPPALRNRTLLQVDFTSRVCLDAFATELEETYVLLWFTLLACSALVTLLLVYLKMSLFTPKYPKLVNGPERCDYDWLEESKQRPVHLDRPLPPPPLIAYPQMFAVCRQSPNSARSPLLVVNQMGFKASSANNTHL